MVVITYRDGSCLESSSVSSEAGALALVENDWRVRTVRLETPHGIVCVDVEEVERG